MSEETPKHKYRRTTKRKIEAVKILPLHGAAVSFDSAMPAVQFLMEYHTALEQSKPLVRFEIEVRYTDGVRIEGAFPEKDSAVEFLNNRHKGLI